MIALAFAALTIQTETLWVQPADPSIYGGDQVGGGTLLGWSPDLRFWLATITVVKGFSQKSAVMAPGFISEWFELGICDRGALMGDGTPLYYGAKKGNKTYLGVGDRLMGPYGVGMGPFVVSPDGKRWAKAMGKDKGYQLVVDGKEVGAVHDYIWPVFFDSSSSHIYARFVDGDSCGLARDGDVLFRYQWVGLRFFIHRDTVFCELGKDGKWTGNDWKGREALGINGQMAASQWDAVYLVGLTGGKPACLCSDSSGDRLCVGDSIFGPYENIGFAVTGPDGRVFYAAEDSEGFAMFCGGKSLSEKRWSMLMCVPDDSLRGYSPGVCATGPGYMGITHSGRSYVVLGEEEYGPYDMATPPVVSLDGKHLAWVVNENDTQRIFLDGEAQQGFDEIMFQSIRFSPSGKHLAYCGMDKRGVWVVLDGRAVAGPFADPALAGRIGTTVSDIYLTDKEFGVMGTAYKEGERIRVLRVRAMF